MAAASSWPNLGCGWEVGSSLSLDLHKEERDRDQPGAKPKLVLVGGLRIQPIRVVDSQLGSDDRLM